VSERICGVSVARPKPGARARLTTPHSAVDGRGRVLAVLVVGRLCCVSAQHTCDM
jgi:hypothetical protein